MNKDDLIRLVDARLGKVGHGMEFAIIPDGVRQEGTWWYVPVVATRKGHEISREITVNVYANIEDEFEQQHGVSLLFVPVVNEPVT